MKANAVNCIVFGIIFLCFPSGVASFLSTDNQAPSIFFLILGIGLVVNGSHLFLVSLQLSPSRFWVFYFSAGDALWVAATVGLLLSGIWITTRTGIQATLLTSFVVGCFGTLQVIKWKEAFAKEQRWYFS